MSPLEKAARALYQRAPNDFDPNQIGEDATWPDLVDMVKAVLQAIREPSEMQTHTVSRILEKRGQYSYQSSAWVWKTMIDAAMEEG